MFPTTDTLCVERPAGSFPAFATAWNRRIRPILRTVLTLLVLMALAAPLFAQAEHHGGGEANLVLPDLNRATFLGGIGGRSLLMGGLLVCALGFIFGLAIFVRLRNMPVHAAMREVSELIYETCKTYLATQGKFLMLLEVFIGVIIVFYFGFLQGFDFMRVLIILVFSV
ncbi:MAG: sodium-translocating pyrophosphatase, partial [Acidobacteria bacterium]|nr:sodium-translocating pyrophosphatase [Acidobacteriota bacterium]